MQLSVPNCPFICCGTGQGIPSGSTASGQMGIHGQETSQYIGEWVVHFSCFGVATTRSSLRSDRDPK